MGRKPGGGSPLPYDRFWDDFLAAARREEPGAAELAWLVRRLERYLAAHPDLPLVRHRARHVSAWLHRAGREPRIDGRQFRQAVLALRICFEQVLAPDWAGDFDWQYWLASARALERSHPTVARDYHGEVLPAPHIGRRVNAQVMRSARAACRGTARAGLGDPSPLVLDSHRAGLRAVGVPLPALPWQPRCG
jgi:hypothetical protein